MRAWKTFYDTLIPKEPTEEEQGAAKDDGTEDILDKLYPIPTTEGTMTATGQEIQDYIDSGKCSVAMKWAWKNLLDTLPQG